MSSVLPSVDSRPHPCNLWISFRKITIKLEIVNYKTREPMCIQRFCGCESCPFDNWEKFEKRYP